MNLTRTNANENLARNEIQNQCSYLKLAGVFITACLLVSIFSNSLTCWIVYVTRELKKPIYFILSAICLINLVATLTELPILILNLFHCGYISYF